jgi:hypothetical protein
MKTNLLFKQGKIIFLSFFLILFSLCLKAQTETFSTGSFIINMGATNPNTIANGLKPYGMIYDLMKNNKVPIKWVISSTKVKDGADFTYNGVDYKGGTFIIAAEQRNAAVNAKITSWQAQGVVGTTTTSPLTVFVTRTLVAVPRWTLDATNGAIAQGYLTNAGIPTTAYNWKAVAALDCCDDFYVMPHADPTWATHNRLFTWNKDCLGSIWAACHAVSALENSINPANAAQQMNFLTTRTAVTAPTPWPNNSLKLWSTHAGGSVAYTHQLPNDQVAQYMGVTDAAQLNGSEQIYIPKQTTDVGGATRWNPGATIIAYDPTQADVPLPNLAGGNVAAVMVYGRGMDDPTRGFVMYEAGHSHNKLTANDVAAQRAFLNFSFFQVQPKAPQLSFSGITGGQTIPGNTTITGLNVSASSPLAGITFTYQWSSSCGGTFSSATGATTNFTAPTVGATTNCIISCVVTDNCGRASFQSFPITILGATPPTANADAQNIDPGCGAATVTKNVLANDVEPDGQPMTLTQINGNTGSFTTANGGLVTFNSNGNVTYTSALGYVGTDVLTYRVCDNSTPTPLCSNGTYTITIGNIANVPNAVNDAATIAEDAILSNFNVLANDLPLISGPLTVSGIAIPPANGKVSINTDNTITYVPNADFAGVDVITYRIVNTLGYSKTATLTVTVTNDACDGGTFQSGSGTPTLVSGNDWSKVYTRPINTGGASLTNTVAYPINAGTNRLLVVTISAGGPNALVPSPTLTWGGKSLTALSANLLTNNRSFSFIFYLKESDIASASGNNLIVNMGTPTYFGYVVYAAVYKDVDQITSVRNAVAPSISGTNSASPITASATADFVAGDQGIFVTGYSTNGGTGVATYSSVSANWTGSASLFGGFTSSANPIGPYYGGVGVRNVTTAATGETVSMTVTATSSMRPSITVVSLIPGSSCATIPARAPLALPDTATTNSTTVITFPVTTNDALFGQAVTSVTISTAASNGTAIVVGNNIQYTPSGTYNGVVTLQYTVTTANGSDVVKVYINITGTPVNAIDDAPAGALSGTVQTINVKANDIDPEGTASSTVTIATAPKKGTATVNGAGAVVYTPNAGFTGNDTLFYSICEPAPTCGSGFCDTARVVILVQNRAPVANNDVKTVTPCIANTINLTGNDTDPENNSLAISVVSIVPSDLSTVVPNSDGTITFTPQAGAAPTYTLTYFVTDNGVTPQVSNNAIVTITVPVASNNAPVALNDYADTTGMDEILYYNVKDNDSDPDGHTLANPTITINPLHGTATVLASGAIKYIPNPGFAGADTLTYQVCDQPTNPATCAPLAPFCTTAKMFIYIKAPNTVVANNDENSTWVNTPVSGGVMANDFDPEGDTKIFTGFLDGGNPVTSGNITVSGIDATGAPVATAGTHSINADGTYTFTPAFNFTGVVTVPYTIADNQANAAIDTAVLRITVSPNTGISNSVIANNDENTTLMNTAVSSTLFGNDADPQSNAFTVTSFQYDTDGDGIADANGTIGAAVNIAGVTSTGLPVTNAGSIIINADGTYTFTPANDFTGSIDAPYTITDALGATSIAILHITILPDLNGALNNPPIPGDDFAYTNINTTVTSSFVSNDKDLNANPISLNGTTIVPGGAHTPIGTTVTTAKGGTIQYYADGTYTYTPPAGYAGPDSTSYTICDVTAVNPQPLCNAGFIHLLIGVNNTTDAVNDENSTWQDVNVSGGVLANDFDKENNTQTFGSFLLQTLSGDMASGATISGTDKTGAPVANAGILSFNASGNYTFDPDPAFTGAVSIPYRLCDNGNLSKCDTAYLTVTIDPLPTTGINTVIANNDENITYGNPVSNILVVNDRDPQSDIFNVTNITGNTVGILFTVSGADQNGSPVANAGTLVVSADGTYIYTPASGFKGSINTSYTITDALGATAIATLHIDVLADPNGLSNDPPFAGDDFSYTTINKLVTGNFINNDSDPNGNPVSFAGTTIVPGGAHTAIGSALPTVMGGTVQFYADGTYTYTPPAGYIGPDAVNYTICDVTAVTPQPLCANAQIQLLVGPGIAIAGKIWDDANGNVIDAGATEPETNIGGTLYVNLLNGSGNVVAVVAVANDGTYNFNNVTPGADYSLLLSTIQGTVGQPAPAASLPSGWTNTGETRNGTIDLGNAGIIDTRTYGFTNTINFDFGIEQLPNTDNKTTAITQPIANQLITLNGGSNPPILSGSDPEDQPVTNVLTNKSIEITTVPANSELYYNGVLVTSGQIINNFNPGLLEIKITATTILSTSTSFTYAYIDAAGKKDPSPATYTLNWLSVLPVTGLKATASLQGETATIKWETLSEQNTDYFVIERSLDNTSFIAVGNQTSAAGTSFNKREYQELDNISSLTQYAIIYYRVKLTDIDGKISYSNVVAVRINKTAGITAWPNPFSSFITINVTTTQHTELEICLTDLAGKTVLNKTQQAERGVSQVTLNSVDKLANGVYMLTVTDRVSGKKTIYKFIKER